MLLLIGDENRWLITIVILLSPFLESGGREKLQSDNIPKENDTNHYLFPKLALTDAAILLPDLNTANPEKGDSNGLQGERKIIKLLCR